MKLELGLLMKRKTVCLAGGILSVALLGVYARPTLPDLSKADFSKECLTVSDPSDRLLFAHEEMVNSFLGVGGKFGKGRVLTIHLSNDHLEHFK